MKKKKTNAEIDTEIEEKVDEALGYLGELDAIEIDENTDIKSDERVNRIRLLIKDLYSISAKEDAQILEEELCIKLREIISKIKELKKAKIASRTI